MNKLTILTFIFALLSTVNGAHAIDQSELLDVDVAFAPEIALVSKDSITLRFNIADKYYLYKHAFKFPNTDSVVKFAEAQIPQGKKKKDEFFGEVETYHHQVDVVIPYQNPQQVSSVPFTFKYQGCAELGVCYPPQRKTIDVALPVA